MARETVMIIIALVFLLISFFTSLATYLNGGKDYKYPLGWLFLSLACAMMGSK